MFILFDWEKIREDVCVTSYHVGVFSNVCVLCVYCVCVCIVCVCMKMIGVDKRGRVSISEPCTGVLCGRLAARRQRAGTRRWRLAVIEISWSIYECVYFLSTGIESSGFCVLHTWIQYVLSLKFAKHPLKPSEHLMLPPINTHLHQLLSSLIKSQLYFTRGACSVMSMRAITTLSMPISLNRFAMRL